MITGIAMSNHTMACSRFDLDPLASAIIGGILLIPRDRIDMLPSESRDIVARLTRKFPAIKNGMGAHNVQSYQMICQMIKYVAGHLVTRLARSSDSKPIQVVKMDSYVPKAQRTCMKKLF
jgi:hypothetical protein